MHRPRFMLMKSGVSRFMLASSVMPLGGLDTTRGCILLVEDEPLIRLFLGDELRDAGYQVIEAATADEAMVLLDSLVPDLVISDVRMPGSLDGIGLLAQIKGTFPAMPVIITSGHSEPSVALANGATKFIRKPYLVGEIVEIVQDELARKP